MGNHLKVKVNFLANESGLNLESRFVVLQFPPLSSPTPHTLNLDRWNLAPALSLPSPKSGALNPCLFLSLNPHLWGRTKN